MSPLLLQQDDAGLNEILPAHEMVIFTFSVREDRTRRTVPSKITRPSAALPRSGRFGKVTR